MSDKIRAVRQHIFGIAFQFKYHENFEIETVINNYLNSLAIAESEEEVVEKVIQVDFDFENDEDLDEDTIVDTKPQVVEEKQDKHLEDFEGIGRYIIDSDTKAYIYRVVSGTYQNLEELDGYIKKYSKKWSFDRLGNEVITILRIAIYELLYNKKVSQKIVINEAVVLAKKYCADDLYKFVNGLLANVAKEINEKN